MLSKCMLTVNAESYLIELRNMLRGFFTLWHIIKVLLGFCEAESVEVRLAL